jgi:hypothetical protein
MMQEGAVPNNLLDISLEGSFENLQKVRDQLKKIFNKDGLLENIHMTQVYYSMKCAEFGANPI